MKKHTFILIICLLLAGCGHKNIPSHITEENYLKADSAIWMEYEKICDSLSVVAESASPEELENIELEAEEILQTTLQRNAELALEYAATPSGLNRLYMVRGDVSKEQISEALQSIPDSMQQSEYGKLLKQHIDTQQLGEGDKFQPFDCTTTEGEPLNWDALSGKNRLLIYGGLGCMGRSGRNYLSQLHKQYPELEIVIYYKVTSSEQLQEEYAAWQQRGVDFDYRAVSDFKGDASPIRIIYGTQATPTCLFISSDGTIKVRSEGLYPERFEAELNK